MLVNSTHKTNSNFTKNNPQALSNIFNKNYFMRNTKQCLNILK